jgi:glycosyltransferase involved in cell wall biosynthesis
MTLRVLHLVPSVGDSFGGLATAVAGYGPIEQALGHHATLLTVDRPEHGTALLRTLRHEWYDVVLLPPGRIAGRYHGGRQVARALRALIPRHDLVVLHSVFDLISQVGHRAAVAAGVPYLLLPHGCLDPYDLVKHGAAKRALTPLWRSAIAAAGALVCTTQRESDRVRTFGARPSRRVVPNHCPAASGGPLDRAAARRRAGLPQTARIVLFLGRLDPKKGLPVLLDGFEAACSPGDLLIVAGTGEPAFERKLRVRAARLAARGQVRFAGWVSGQAKQELLAAADLFVLVSENENFGNSVVETLAAGTPALLSPDVYLADELGPAGAASICDRTGAAVGQRIRALLEDPDSRRALADAGRRFVVDRLSLPAIVPRYQRVVTEVCR